MKLTLFALLFFASAAHAHSRSHFGVDQNTLRSFQSGEIHQEDDDDDDDDDDDGDEDEEEEYGLR